MKKIALDMETLRVESFETTAAAADRKGTVHAAGESEDTGCESQGLTYCGSCGPTDCLDPSCGPPCEPTFPSSCEGTCMGESCDSACVIVTC